MCEMLVKATDNTHPDPDIDLRCCWKQNDIVVAMDDGHVWGAQEGPPKFTVVSLPGIPKASVAPYCQSWMTDPTDPNTMQRRSLYWWDSATQEFVNKETGVRTHKDNI